MTIPGVCGLYCLFSYGRLPQSLEGAGERPFLFYLGDLDFLPSLGRGVPLHRSIPVWSLTPSNLRAVLAVGGVAYIPFKNRTTGMGSHSKAYDSLWNRMWCYYQFNQAAFMEHYHKRSNVETVFSIVKVKFGASVRAKTPIAQVNEVLCKILAHNICVLIASMYELGIDPTFRSKVAVAPKVAALVDF